MILGAPAYAAYLLRPPLALVLVCLLALLLFVLDTAVSQVHFWGSYLLPIVLIFLWGRRRDIYVVTALTSVFIFATYWLDASPTLEDFVFSHLLPFAILWGAAWLLSQHRQLQDQLARREQDLEVEAKARTAALQASEENYRALFDHAGGGIFVLDAKGCFLDANDHYCRMLGRTPAEVTGAYLGDMTLDVSPELFAAVGAELMEHGSVSFERRLRHKDGTFPEVEVTVTRLSGGRRMAVVHDITARKTAEHALAAAELKWRSVFEFLPVGVSVVDHKDQVTDTNSALAQILHMTPEGILQGTYARRRYFHPDLTPMLPSEFPSQRALREGCVVRDVVIGVERENGELIWVNVSATPASLDGYAVTVTADITPRKQLEDALAAGEARLRALIENTADNVWSVDRSCRLLVGNSPFMRSMQQQIGRPLAPGECVVAAPFPPSVRAFWQPIYDRALAGESFTIELPSILRPGGILACYLHPIHAADGTITGVSARAADITELKQAEARLHEAYLRLRLAADAADIGVWNWNFADDQLEWDERICDLYAVPRAMRADGIYYRVWRDRVHPDDLAANESSLAAARRDGTDWASTFRIAWPDGQIRYIYSACVVEQDRQGAPLRMVGINRDVTDQKRYEQLLQETNVELENRVAARTADLQAVLAQLQAALADLRHANGLKDEFLAMISHELRTPLTGVLSMAEMLEDQVAGPLNDRQAYYVKAITHSGERLLNVVNGILSYTHLLSGKVQLQAEPCELGYLLDVCAASLRRKAADRQQTMTVRVEPPDLAIGADATAVAEVIKRLLDNAIKFTPEGGQIGLQAHYSSAPKPATGISPATVDLVVWDTGIGIAPAQFDHVFHAFTQADARLARSHEGLGLGLAYVDQMVRLLGGTLTLESAEGCGSRFTLTLPAKG